MRSLGARVDLGASLASAARASWAALDAPLAHDAELRVSVLGEDGVLLGAFQRACELPADVRASYTFMRRASGGAAARVAEGTVHAALALPSVSALVPCTTDKILNRYVRPLLRALGRAGASAHYFGRDWVSVQHRPAALVAFAHDAGSGRTVLEIVAGVRVPFATHDRPSFLGKEPAALAELGAADPERVARAIVEAYAEAYGLEPQPLAPHATDGAAHALVTDDPPWAATEDEAIGAVAAGPDARGAMRIGGELMASRDAMATLEARLAALPAEDVGDAIDGALGRPGIAVFGIRSLASLQRVVLRARALDAPLAR